MTGRAIVSSMDSAFDPPLLHPLLAGRWSPTRFDASYDATADEVDALVEAARWAPSAGNSQPWSFIVGVRGDDTHGRLVEHLAASSAVWVPGASLLIANLAHRYVEGTDWEYSEFSHYDLGQAVAHMTLQAQALGMSARQFRAFDRAGVAAEFAVPEHWEVTTLIALGRAATSATAAPTPRPVSGRSRQRRTAGDILWPVT